MATYSVSINGENFLLEEDGEAQRLGFYTTRFVEADTREDAELAAIQLIRDEPKLQHPKNKRSDPPMLYADEIVQVEPGSVPDTVPGLAFYRSA